MTSPKSDDVSEEGELLARWLDEQSFFYTSDERAQQNLRRAAAFIREAYLQTATSERHAINPVFGHTLCGADGMNAAPGQRINCPKCRIVINSVLSLDDRYSVPRIPTARERKEITDRFLADMYGDQP